MKPADRAALATVYQQTGITPGNLSQIAQRIEDERHHRRALMVTEPNAATRRKEIAASTERSRLLTAAYDEQERTR